MRSHLKTALALLGALLSCVAVFFLMVGGIPTADSPAQNTKRYHIEVVLKARANPPDFWRIIEQGISLSAAEFAVDYTVTGPVQESDVDSQIQLVEQAIARQPDALILAAGDYDRLVPLCDKAIDAGIPVVIVDSDLASSRKSCFVGTDNYELGKKLAEQVEALIGPGEQFGVIGHVQNTSTAMGRIQGLLDGITFLDRRFAAIAYCEGSTGLAKAQTIEMLAQYPNIKCMVGLNESSALGICMAFEELQLTDEVSIVTCDSSVEQIQYMEKGVIQAFVMQNPFHMGYLSMQAAVNLLDGKRVDPVLNTGSILITRDDLRKKEYQKLLFPFTE